MTSILGISAFYHDSAAALVVDGKIIAAAQEERFTRKKHDQDFPRNAVAYCLREAGIESKEIDYVGFYDKPLLKFDRILETYLAFAPQGFNSFIKAIPLWLRQKLFIPQTIRKELGGDYKRQIVFCEHHESHAASAFFPSPFEKAAILTIDGVGEWATCSMGVGQNHQINLSHELHFPHSLGLLYSAFTYYCGFKVNSGEYKLMGLAPYGRPLYEKKILDHLIDLKEDGSFRMDQSYFNYCQGLTMTSSKFHALFGGPPRTAEAKLEQRFMDIASSIQKVTEEIVLRMARHIQKLSGQTNLCLAGGVALNCVANGRLLREGTFENIWVQPAAGDAGGALGVALFIWHQLLQKPRTPTQPDAQHSSWLGPHYSNEDIRLFLDNKQIPYLYFENETELLNTTVSEMANEKVVGWFQNRMEFGPRALGCRSILGDARSTKMQSVMNLKIKFRESFRPFAPSILRERVQDYFDVREQEDSPYMLLVAEIQKSKRVEQETEANVEGLDLLKMLRSEVPAITHVDYSARIQTVDKQRHDRYYRLLKAFEQKTGCPVVINTSFNVRSEPIVCSPEDAYRCFMGTDMDILVMENFLLYKEAQPNLQDHQREIYLSQFELD